MKRSFLIGLITMLMMGLILVACGSSPSPVSTRQAPPNKWANVSYTGEDERLLEGTIWVFPFTDNTTLEFRRGGRLVVNHPAWRGNASWKRIGDTVEFVMNDGFIYFEGIYYPETQRILGTAHDSYNHVSDQTMVPAGSSIATPNSPSSTTNVYVQPSAPAQNPAPTPAPAPSAPTFQTGTYAWSNSGQNMTMQFSVGMVFAQFNNRQIWRGTYSINGTQLVISVTSAISDYSRLQGMTYSYTITSNTSFSGSGETWVRTGY